MNYRGFGLAWLVVWLLAAPAWAAVVTTGELSLNPSGAWQRAPVEEEGELDSVVLRQDANGLEVFLPRHRIRPKMEAAKFIEQLEQNWRRRYGEQVAMGWLDAAGARWRVCRRPSQSGDGQVFQIVTVRGPEVYQMVAMAPAGVEVLPEEVRSLLTGAIWAGGKSPAGPETPAVAAKPATPPLAPPPQAAAPSAAAPVAKAAITAVGSSPVPVATPTPVSEPTPKATPVATPVAATKPVPVPKPAPLPKVASVAAPAQTAAPIAVTKPAPATEPAAKAPAAVPAKPAPALVGGKWRLMRTLIALPGGKAWPALAEAEGGQIGSEGLLEGLGLTAIKSEGVDAFLEGYLWHKGDDGIARKRPFRRHWRAAWSSLPEAWQGGEELAFDLDLLAETTGLEGAGALGVRFELTPVCAPRKDLIRWLDGLAANGPEGMAELAGMACLASAGGPDPVTVSLAAKEATNFGNRVKKRVHLALPVAWERGLRANAEGDARRLILIARFQSSESGRGPGDLLLRQAVALFVFGPQ
jgi:hypothetical protein